MKILLSALMIAAAALSGCTRIETGSVGVRVDATKAVQPGELTAGGIYQTVIGSILEFPVKDIVVAVDNKTPMTSDNSALEDFDVTVVYNINPASVAELYSTKSRSFHSIEGKSGDVLLMHSYISTLVNNASYKIVRAYPSLAVADNRQKIEQEIRETVTATLKEEKLDTAITLSVVQIRNILPNKDILASATQLVKSQNEIKIKENEVKLAVLESERMNALAANSGQSVAYMNAQSNMIIAKAIEAGKVNTIIVPSNLTMLGNIK